MTKERRRVSERSDSREATEGRAVRFGPCHRGGGSVNARLLAWLGIVIAFTLSGCSSVDERLASARAAYVRGSFADAERQLQELMDDDPRNALVYELEASIVQIAVGQTARAERLLGRATQRLDDYKGKTLSDRVEALLTDDRSIEYGGEDYERVLARAILALASLGGDGRDALAYANQIIETQADLIQSNATEYQEVGLVNPRSSEDYKLVAIGSYLVGIIEEANPLRASRAEAAFTRVQELSPQFRDAESNRSRAANRPHNGPGKGVLHVLTLTGRGPYKIEAEERATAEALEIARILWSTYRGDLTIPILAPLKVPELAFHSGNPGAVAVHVDGHPVGTTATVTDVEDIAARQFGALRDHVMARAILRRIFKLGVIEGAKAAVAEHHEENRRRDRRKKKRRRRPAHQEPLTKFLIQLFGALWIGIEEADLRHWGLLPASFQALRIELDPGEYTIDLRPILAGDHAPPGIGAGGSQTIRVRVRENSPTFVVALVPTMRGGPKPLSSESVDSDEPTPIAEPTSSTTVTDR